MKKYRCLAFVGFVFLMTACSSTSSEETSDMCTDNPNLPECQNLDDSEVDNSSEIED